MGILLMVLSTFGLAALILTYKHHMDGAYTIELVAREPDHGNWFPREITVRKGEKVRVTVRNIETVSHGLAIPDFNIGIPEIKAGHVETLEFTPDKTGRFPFVCTVWCSPRHPEMTGTLIVE